MKSLLDDKIDKYLSGLMKETELISFEKEIKGNGELEKEILFKKDLYFFLKTRNPELIQNLKRLGNDYFEQEKNSKFPGKHSLILIIIAIVLISVLGLFLYYSNQNNVAEIEGGTQEFQIEETNVLEEDLEKMEFQDLDEAIEEKVEIPMFIPEKPKKSVKKNQAIAKAENYNENALLESLIRENTRSETLSYLHEIPKNSAIYKQNSSEFIRLKIIAKMNAAQAAELIIYDNDTNKFNKDIKVLIADIEAFKLSEEQFELRFDANIPLEKGLYYYIIQTKKNREILYVSKFIVE